MENIIFKIAFVLVMFKWMTTINLDILRLAVFWSSGISVEMLTNVG